VDPNDPKNNATLAEVKGNIVFDKVNFTYPTRKDLHVLKDFSCTFEAGKTTAIVGPSGSGKSTIIQLIERFYAHDSGVMTIDGVNIETLDIRKFRRQMGYVGQEPVLFNASIKENMKYAKPNASDKEIEEALIAANAWGFIQKMDKKLDTMVGGSGGSLSGGQK
jgi:ATP-binding cassette subfamily B (MDR/TAP) protein 1